MPIRFADSGRTTPRGDRIWNLRGPAAELVPGTIVTVDKRGGKPIRKVVGPILDANLPGGEALASIHPTLTVAQAEKAARKAAKTAKTAPAATDDPAAEP